MAADLPTEFDVVVLGTGMPESILAAAFSRIGYKVLHLDRNDYYSSGWASFNIEGLEKWKKRNEDGQEVPANVAEGSDSNEFTELLKEGEKLVNIPQHASDAGNIKTEYHVSDGESESGIPKRAQSKWKNSASMNIKAQTDSLRNTTAAKTSEDSEKKSASEAALESSSSHQTSSEEVVPSPSEADKTTLPEEASPSCGDADQTTSHKVVPSPSEVDKTTLPEEASPSYGDADQTTSHKVVPSTSDVGQSTLHKAVPSANNADQTSHKEMKEENFPSDSCEQPGTLDEGQVTKESSTPAETDVGEKCKIWTKASIKENWRRFNLDLAPKVLYSNSSMVELLISSDVAKYCEFRSIGRVLTLLNGQLEKVPCSRADVFASKKVSMLEKRMLMKFLTFCAEYEKHLQEYQLKDFINKPFVEFLNSRKLTPNIRHYAQHSIAMATDETKTEEGLKKMQQFLHSLGRYGNTAFLFPLYGSGELPQGFCRLCAVFGGTYCLQMSARSLIINQHNRCCAIVTTEKQRIQCKWLILGSTYSPPDYVRQTEARYISRAVLLTDKSVMPTDGHELSLLNLTLDDDRQRPVTILELPPSSMVCPPDMYVVHLTRQGSGNAEADLTDAIRTLFSISGEADDKDKPSVLWSLYFSHKDFSDVTKSEHTPKNVYVMSGPGTDLDMDSSVAEARAIWEEMCPEEDFLPKPPNPEDIIYVDDAEARAGDGGDLIAGKTGSQEEGNDRTSSGTQEHGTETGDALQDNKLEGTEGGDVYHMKTENVLEESRSDTEVDVQQQTGESLQSNQSERTEKQYVDHTKSKEIKFEAGDGVNEHYPEVKPEKDHVASDMEKLTLS